MLWTITKKTVMAFMATLKPTEGFSMPELEHRLLRLGSTSRHMHRLHAVIATLKRKGWVFFDDAENKIGKYSPTPDGIAWSKGERVQSTAFTA